MQDDLLVRLVSAFGPRNMPKIARRLGVSREVAARAYSRLTEEGLGPRPNIKMKKLGLKRFIALAKPDTNAGPQPLSSLFSLMGDYAYLEHYQKLDPSNTYLLVFAGPPNLQPQVNDFLATLGETNVLRVIGPTPLSWMRYHPIRAPWNPPPTEPVLSGPLAYVPNVAPEIEPDMKNKAPEIGPDMNTRAPEIEPNMNKVNVEYRELLLLAALQAHPSANLTALSETLAKWADAGYEEIKSYSSASTSEWNQSLNRALRFVESFPVHLSRGEPGLTKRKRHHWASFTAWWTNLSENDIRRAAMASTSIPYLRTDAASNEFGMYFSVTSAPSNLIPSYLTFMSQNAPPGMNIAIPSKFANYSLPFASFVPEEGRWAWKQERLESVLATLRAV